MLNSLREKNQIANTLGYKISFTVATQDNQFGDPNQGMVFRNCEATRTDQAFAMKITDYYEHPPVFAPPGSPRNYRAFDYDPDGNLIVWRSLEKYILSEPARNDSIEKVRVFFVDPNGQIVRTADNILFHRWRIDKPYSTNQFKYYQLPTGRGFSRHLGNVASVKSLTSGLMKVTSKGSCGPSWQGTWELTVDPNADYLVREAIFTTEGQHKPIKTITSSGVVEKDGIRLAKYGTYRSSSGFELSVEVTDISKVVGENELYEEVLSHLNSPLPPGSQVMDRRGDKPVVTTVE
ncbi:MAG: hypothetical protein JXB29_07965 [Sedimentisphaerales bacterium]|nr:hypothetical protein [Sedimentisphaerales bacterium]